MSFILLILFFAFILLGIPLGVSLGLASITVLFFSSNLPLVVAANTIFGSMNSFIMVAVPLFILAGILMESGGVATRIFDFANSLVGHWRGGLGHVNVMASMLFGGISGSSVADAASLGAIEVAEMEKKGYPRDYAAAISVASSALASIIPPSILLIVAGTVGNQSVGQLLIAGIVPGGLIAFSLMLGNFVLSARNKYGKKTAFSGKKVFRSFIKAIPALLSPLIIMGGIMLGSFTPTEAAAIAVVYTIMISVLFYRIFDWKKMPSLLYKAAKSSGTILFIAMTAKIATWIFTIDGLPDKLANLILSISSNPNIVLLSIIIFLIILGMFMDVMAALIILVPIFLPTAVQVGINPIHFLVTMVGALTIGLVTPPVGVCLFAICNVSQLTMESVVKRVWPFIIILIAAILLIAFVPQLSLYLPTLFWN
ncbi:MAG: TRAP transporter large permease [Halanaerobiales bacterium]|nr:TRAP transporter large permease [Halanaerobiales bacterium]